MVYVLKTLVEIRFLRLFSKWMMFLECHSFLLCPLLKDVFWGILVSVCPCCILCPPCSAYSSGWFHYIFIHLIKQLQKLCHVLSFFVIISVFGNFFKNCNFDSVLFWLMIWYQSLLSMRSHGVAGVSQNCCQHYKHDRSFFKKFVTLRNVWCSTIS